MRRLALSLALTTALASPALAFDISAMTDAERDAFGAEVKAWLLANPEVLNEMVQALDARQQAAQAEADVALISANAEPLFSDPASWVGGNPEGDVTLVEFVDYRCGYCRKAFAEVEELVKADGKIRFVLKELPILGPESDLAGKFAVATLQVAGPEAYKKVHDAFYTEFRGAVTAETLAAFAKGLDLDPAPILAAMDSQEVAKVLADNHALAERMQINGTPGFVIGKASVVRGYVPLAGMAQVVAGERGQ